MAWYITGTNVSGISNNDAFVPLHGPGDRVVYSGIYKCQGCNREITSNNGDPFPPQNHHQHTLGQGAIRWRLLVMTNTGGL